jgi:hypothetical protein
MRPTSGALFPFSNLVLAQAKFWLKRDSCSSLVLLKKSARERKGRSGHIVNSVRRVKRHNNGANRAGQRHDVINLS